MKSLFGRSPLVSRENSSQSARSPDCPSDVVDYLWSSSKEWSRNRISTRNAVDAIEWTCGCLQVSKQSRAFCRATSGTICGQSFAWLRLRMRNLGSHKRHCCLQRVSLNISRKSSQTSSLLRVKSLQCFRRGSTNRGNGSRFSTRVL